MLAARVLTGTAEQLRKCSGWCTRIVAVGPKTVDRDQAALKLYFKLKWGIYSGLRPEACSVSTRTRRHLCRIRCTYSRHLPCIAATPLTYGRSAAEDPPTALPLRAQKPVMVQYTSRPALGVQYSDPSAGQIARAAQLHMSTNLLPRFTFPFRRRPARVVKDWSSEYVVCTSK